MALWWAALTSWLLDFIQFSGCKNLNLIHLHSPSSAELTMFTWLCHPKNKLETKDESECLRCLMNDRLHTMAILIGTGALDFFLINISVQYMFTSLVWSCSRSTAHLNSSFDLLSSPFLSFSPSYLRNIYLPALELSFILHCICILTFSCKRKQLFVKLVGPICFT